MLADRIHGGERRRWVMAAGAGAGAGAACGAHYWLAASGEQSRGGEEVGERRKQASN